VLLESLNRLGDRQNHSVADTLTQMQCMSCLRTVMNFRPCLHYIVERNEYTRKLATSKWDCLMMWIIMFLMNTSTEQHLHTNSLLTILQPCLHVTPLWNFRYMNFCVLWVLHHPRAIFLLLMPFNILRWVRAWSKDCFNYSDIIWHTCKNCTTISWKVYLNSGLYVKSSVSKIHNQGRKYNTCW